MFRGNESPKVHNRLAGCTALGLALFLSAFGTVACGSAAEPAEAVMKPDVERIPQSEDQDGTEYEGALKGRDTLALTIEAMKEDGKDTALVEGKIATKGLAFEIPEGFTESKDTPNLYVTRRYPLDATNIYYKEMEADPALQYMTKEDYEEIIAERMGPDGSDAPADYKITEFKEMKFDGIPGFRIKSTCTYHDLTITQTAYIVNADKTYILTYTMTNEYDRSDWFEASERSIRVKK